MTVEKAKKQYASIDTVYSEASADVRQVRDYELNSAKWYTTILVALVGFLLATKFAPTEKTTELSNLLNNNLTFQLIIAFIISSIAFFLHFR